MVLTRSDASYGNESVTSLIPQKMPEKVKPPMHMSKHRPDVAAQSKDKKAANKTMGPAKVLVSPPTHYLKKSNKALPDPAPVEKKATRKPALPTEQNQPSRPTEKDFIRTNAIENITSVPRKPKAQYCDTKDGHKNDLISSGLVPRFTMKSDFGSVPEYLVRRKEETKQAQDRYDEYVAEELRARALEQVDDMSRAELLRGLKQKWEDLHQKFQGLSVVTDTAPKKNRKERMEAQMSQLERDIDLLERHTTIYVARR